MIHRYTREALVAEHDVRIPPEILCEAAWRRQVDGAVDHYHQRVNAGAGRDIGRLLGTVKP